jgi:CRP-like cAMP-binding protein
MPGRFKPRLASWPLDPVLRKLRSQARLSEGEEALVRALTERRERFSPGEELIGDGQPSRRPRFVVAGWAAYQRVLADGRRQIFSFILPGDLMGYAPKPPPPALCSLTALTALETIDAELVAEAAESGRGPGLAAAIEGLRKLEGQLLLDHMVRLGQQTAYERVAHFLLELQRRLQIVGLGDAQRFPLPLTQEMLADALGLSIVHVNRTLQQLRRDGLIELRSGVAILLRPEALSAVSDYDTLGAFRAPPPAAQPVKRPA